jgi:hypothetical protein
MVELPDPLPFSDVSFEPRQSLKYRSNIDVQKLITAAKVELSEAEPECFKIFLLAVMVGLRRREIDLLEWSSFRWDFGMIASSRPNTFCPRARTRSGTCLSTRN